MARVPTTLLVDPVAESVTPPLDLLRQATALRHQGFDPKLYRGIPHESWPEPSEVIFTTVFSWHYPQLETAITTARKLWPYARLRLSGVLARRMGPALGSPLGVSVFNGSIEASLDELRPDYSLVPEWDASILITSKGVCPRECAHCDASWQRKRVTRLIDAWPKHLDIRLPRVEVWDNTLMLTPRGHYERLADTLVAFERPVDMVCGITPAGVPNQELIWRIERLQGLHLAPLRLECNVIQDLDRLRKLWSVAQKTFSDATDVRAFAVINGDEGPLEASRRLEQIEAEGLQVDPIVFTPHDWLSSETYIHKVRGWTKSDIHACIERWPSACNEL